MFVIKSLADDIINTIPIVYNQMEVEEWLEGLPVQFQQMFEEGAKSFLQHYPKLGIFYFNFVMQGMDETLSTSPETGKLVLLPHHEETYREGLTRRTLDSRHDAARIEETVQERVAQAQAQMQSQMQMQQPNRRNTPAERVFGYFEGMTRTPFGEYQAFANMRDMGDSLDNIRKEIRDLKNR
jgi:hypothetical protein